MHFFYWNVFIVLFDLVLHRRWFKKMYFLLHYTYLINVLKKALTFFLNLKGYDQTQILWCINYGFLYHVDFRIIKRFYPSRNCTIYKLTFWKLNVL